MDLLKGITRELRGRETSGDESLQTTGNSRPSTDRRRSTGDADDSPNERTDHMEGHPVEEDADAPDEDTESEASDPNREDEHVCSFCETEFEASRGSCPECDAEIVFRGER